MLTARAALARSRWLPFLVGVALGGPFCFAPISETDLGWHLALGRLIAHGGIPRENALAWTHPHVPWYATSWLFDWICYRADVALGPLGLQLVTFVLFAATVAGVTVACDRVDPGRGAWLAPVMALLLAARVTPRPHMFSWALLAGCLALCLAARDRSWHFRAACIPLIALGSNFHAGAIFSAVAVATFCAEAALLERHRVREGLLAALGFMALMANPGGPFNVLYATEHLRVYELVKLSEFQTPRPLDLPAFYLLIPLAVGLALLRARRSPAGVVLVLGFAAGGIWAARVAFKFYIVAGPILAAGMPVFQERYGRRARALLGMLLALSALGINAHRFWRLRPSARWDAGFIPVRAVGFIRAHGLGGRYFNSFQDGGYLEYALPGLPAFQDARVQAYPPDFFLDQLAAEQDPEAFDRYLRGLGVEWALTQNQDFALTGNRLGEVPGWALVYWDEENEVLVRRDVPRYQSLVAQSEFHYFHPARVTPSSIPEVVGRLGRAELQAYLAEVERFEASTPDDPYAALARCALATRLASAEAPRHCNRAWSLGDDEELQALVERARQLAPVP